MYIKTWQFTFNYNFYKMRPITIFLANTIQTIGHGFMSRKSAPKPNLVTIGSVGASGQIHEIYDVCDFLNFSPMTWRPHPLTNFHAKWLKRRGLTHRCASCSKIHTFCNP